MRPEPARKRLFFALWPDKKIAGELHRTADVARQSCGGRAMRRDTLHLTLVFLGEVDGARIARLNQAASAVAAPVFRFKLDRLDYWRHQRLLWAGCGEQSAELLQLVRQLRDGLFTAGFSVDTTSFTPHVTLVRDASCKGSLPPFPRIEWSVAEFMLVESLRSARGAHYRPVSRWPLRAASA